MGRSRLHWIHIIFSLLLTTITAKHQICKRSENCQCFNNSDHYEFQCSKNLEGEGEIILHIYPNSLIHIECNNIPTFDIQLLPKIKFENAKKLRINYCPVPENGTKEIIEHFGMKTINGFTFEYGIFNNFTLETIKFNGLLNITELRLRGNDLKYIGDNFFNNFPELQSLELDRNDFVFNNNSFSSLSKLKFLSISDNKIEDFPEGFFKDLKQLETLNLWKNNLKILHNSSFNGLRNLKSLEVAFNNIEEIEETAFYTLPNLTNLSIRSNSLKKLPEKLFLHNPYLEEVVGSGNRKLILEGDVFSNLKYLKKVELRNCDLNYLSENLFKNSTSLEIISLEENGIQKLPNSFKVLSKMKDLSLGYNKIGFLENDIFTSLIQLEVLDLQHNNLKEINDILLKPLTKLKEINLNYNNITNVHPNAFIWCKNLIKLSMNHNRYIYEDKGFYPISPFSKCKELQEIDLSYNQILDFPEDLVLLVSIKDINLSRNNISTLRVNGLWKLAPNELKINLDHNNIYRLNFDNVEITALQQPNLDAYHRAGEATVIKISKNPIVCDCFAYDFVKYIRNEMYPGVKTAIYFVYDDIQCVSPEIFKGISLENITTPMLNCPIKDVIENFTCTENNKCGCFWRPYDNTYIIDCENKNLTTIPEIYYPYHLNFNQTEVRLQRNFLKNAPLKTDVSYANVSKLFLENNSISQIEWIPPNLEILDLQNNNLTYLHYKMLERLNSSSFQKIVLHGNPWKCDCLAVNFTNFLRQHVHEIDTRYIFCESSDKLLINYNQSDLCPHNSLLLASATVAIFVLCILTSLAAFYYKFQQEIKVWMYAHNLCLFLIEEEELDKDKIYDAFVSYSHKDEDFVIENLISILEGGPQPYKLCIHFRNWIPGEFIATQVTSSVKDSKRTLVILSNNFLESVWGKMEFRTAHTEAMREGRARVIIVLLDDINVDRLDDELKAYMKTNTYIKWGDPWFWDKLKYALPHSKIKKVSNNKHANMMKFIDDKFSLVGGKKPEFSNSKNDVKIEAENTIAEHKIV